MTFNKLAFCLGLLLATSTCFAQTTNNGNIKIHGTTFYGYAESFGDFNINGQGLNLFQSWPDGPGDGIGFCTVDTECTITFSPSPTSSLCAYCWGRYSSGLIGGLYAPYLEPNLIVTATGFYHGGTDLRMHVTVKGTVTGYQLLNCDGRISCQLGPALFTVRISGQGPGEAEPRPDWNSATPTEVPINGVGAFFSGVARVGYP